MLQDIVNEILARGVCITRTRAGARQSAAEYSPYCYGVAVSQGVRARGRREKGCGHEGAREAEMCVCAYSGLSPPPVCHKSGDNEVRGVHVLRESLIQQRQRTKNPVLP